MAIDFSADMAIFFNGEEFAFEASYEPPSGASVPCVVHLDERDAEASYEGARFLAAKAVVSVLKSQLPAPVAKGVFVVTRKDGSTERYVIGAQPKIEDPDGLVWTCPCDPE